MEGGRSLRRKGLKEIILTVEALEEGHLPEQCVLMLNSVTAEMPDPVRIRLQSGREKWMVRKNGILAGKIRARAGIVRFPYGFFEKRLRATIITDIQVEIFNFRQAKNVPFTVRKLEFVFENGKKLDYTNRISVFSLNQMAG